MSEVQNHVNDLEAAPAMAPFRVRLAGGFLMAAGFSAFGLMMLTTLTSFTGTAHTLWAWISYFLGLTLVGLALRRDYPHAEFGLCNTITLIRLMLVAALVAPMTAAAGPSWYVVVIAALAVSLDGADGWIARRQGHVSSFGARFDMEVDAALAFVLALNASLGAQIGWIVLVLGLPRYLFALAGLVFPWLRKDLPNKISRKGVCVAQLSGLLVLQIPGLPAGIGQVLVPSVGILLGWSFLRDIAWLYRQRR